MIRTPHALGKGLRVITVEVNGSENPDAAWYYPETSELAKGIKNHVAFGKASR